MDQAEAVRKATERVLRLEAELEAEGDATKQGDDLDRMRGILKDWVDSVVAVVSSPGVGRVTLIHADGGESKIASPSLPYSLSKPVTFSN